MNRKKSEKWDEKEKQDTHRFVNDGVSYEGSWPYLPKKVTIVFVGIAVLMAAGIPGSVENGKRIELENVQRIEAMSCLELHEYIESNLGNSDTTRDGYWAKRSLAKFLDECSSYGGFSD